MNNFGEYSLINSLDGNIDIIREVFKDDDTLMMQKFQNQNNSNIKCCIFFIDGMVDNKILDENIIKPITINNIESSSSDLINNLQNQIIISSQCKKTKDILSIVNAIIDGDTVLF